MLAVLTEALAETYCRDYVYNAEPRRLDDDVEVDAEQHERPEEHRQDKRQEFADIVDHISVGERYHYPDD